MFRKRSILFFFFFCLTLVLVAPVLSLGQGPEDVEARRARLQAELEAEEREIARQTELLRQKQKEGATLKGELDLLVSQIKQAQIKIQERRVAISRLESEILKREQKIGELENRIRREQASLAELLRKTRDNESFSLLEMVFAAEELPGFFKDLDDFELVQTSLHKSFAAIRAAQNLAATEKTLLLDQKEKETDAKQMIEYEQKLIKNKETEKQRVLALTKNQESLYQQVIKERQRRAAEIRSALFALRDTAAIPFGRALELANEAQSKTGVRPAFLLAILQQESNLGENVGTCNRPTDPPNKKWPAIMKPSRDHAPYLRITSELGLDPNSLPLSCPYQGGWGGAMGPAQFIPSTWELFKSKIASLLGIATPNPWEPRDAFMAAALYLAELGAKSGTFSSERHAACRYYSGRSCGVGKPANAFYGDGVMVKAENIQLNMIDPLREV